MKLAIALNCLPWRLFTRYVARAKGFVDPVAVYAQLQRFAQPSEVGEPVELLRAGMVFHARGLLNSKVIQHNLDWVWPYWVERQFDPTDASFLPRAFSITHINLTHRNWTAIGYPGLDATPIVDPRGLLTPFWDSWSLDVWAVGNDDGHEIPEMLLPSRDADVQQHQSNENALFVSTQSRSEQFELTTNASVVERGHEFVCCLQAKLTSKYGGWLVLAARPYNPEGISFIHQVSLSDDRKQWRINEKDIVRFDRPVDKHIASDYERGDIHIHFADGPDVSDVTCPVGMATAAALFHVPAGDTVELEFEIPLSQVGIEESIIKQSAAVAWAEAREQAAVLKVEDARVARLYAAACDTLVLMTPGEVYAGPYTYRRYWYRDTVFIAHGLLSAGLIDRVSDIIAKLALRQNRNGYFHSQEGEWDSNGQVLWLLNRFVELGGNLPSDAFKKVITNGADWIIKKRRRARHGPPWQGLMPAGFSAEHLGPNDHYYWDNYWSIAGLKGAANLMALYDDTTREKRYHEEAATFADVVSASVNRAQVKLPYPAIPAAPTRRLDAGAIGSVVASYPLQLLPPDDAKMKGTTNYLIDQCFHAGGFFQDMIHSGVNAYLTLHVAQVLLRSGDSRYLELMDAVIEHASPTGHWPEAVHPHTGGGCMGDGHHAWAAAEWIAMVRSCFVREEGDTLVLGSGVPDSWIGDDKGASFGPIQTRFGRVHIAVERLWDSCQVTWEADWRSPPMQINVAIPGYEAGEFEAFESHTCKTLKVTNGG